MTGVGPRQTARRYSSEMWTTCRQRWIAVDRRPVVRIYPRIQAELSTGCRCWALLAAFLSTGSPQLGIAVMSPLYRAKRVAKVAAAIRLCHLNEDSANRNLV